MDDKDYLKVRIRFGRIDMEVCGHYERVVLAIRNAMLAALDDDEDSDTRVVVVDVDDSGPQN